MKISLGYDNVGRSALILDRWDLSLGRVYPGVYVDDEVMRSLDSDQRATAMMLVRDTFYAMFKFDPQIRSDMHGPRVSFLDWIINSGEFTELHYESVANVYAASAAAGALWEMLLQKAPIQNALSDMGGQSNNGMEKQSESGQSPPDKPQKMSKNVLAQAMMNQALKQAKEEAEQTSQSMRAWGMEFGFTNELDINVIMQLMKDNNNLVKDLGSLIGRLQGMASSTLEQVKPSQIGTIAAVDLTRDLMHIFPTERIYMSPQAPKLLRTAKVLNWISGGLIGWKQLGEGRRSGSFVAMIDGSGSMGGFNHGYSGRSGHHDEIYYAVAVALGIANAALGSGTRRRWSLGMFGMEENKIKWLRDDSSAAERIKWAINSPGGGTDFDYAFDQAIRELVRLKDRESISGCDYLFVTDGECRLSDYSRSKWLRHKEQTNSRLYYVQIGGRMNDTVRDLADAVYQLSKLDNDSSSEMLVEVVKQIANREDI